MKKDIVEEIKWWKVSFGQYSYIICTDKKPKVERYEMKNGAEIKIISEDEAIPGTVNSGGKKCAKCRTKVVNGQCMWKCNL